MVEYESAEYVLEAVRAMRPKGGSAYGQAAAQMFRFVALDAAFTTVEALLAALNKAADDLLEEKPTMATIHNARSLIIDDIHRVGAGGNVDAVRGYVVRRADLFLRMSEEAVDGLGAIGCNLIEDGQTIMMHSYSQSVMSVFRHAREAGKQFTVICTESRPLRESRFAVNQLTALAIPVTLVLDTAMALAVPGADWCIAGADSLSITGSVANKVGTDLLSILCGHFGRPLYIATEVFKLQRATQQGYPILMEQRPPGEIVDVAAEFDHPQHLTVRNQFFDFTPARRIEALITERGLIPPAMIGQMWMEIEERFATAV